MLSKSFTLSPFHRFLVTRVRTNSSSRFIAITEKFNILPSPRRDNPRDNEGTLNKSINLGCRISRRSVVATVGNFDRYKCTNYCDVWFRFSRKMVQGFWRWWAAADTTRLVVWSGRPKRYREQVDFNLTLDSLRGLPIFACMVVPGGFVVLGASLYLLPTWFVLPRTFWNHSDIRQFLERQYSDREAFRKNIENYIAEFRRLNPGNPEGYQTLPLDKLPYDVLHALAQGHGFYLSTKFPIEALLQHKLMNFVENLNKQDKMLKSESIVGYLTHRELAWACYRRGFFPTNVLKISSRGILLKVKHLEHTRSDQENYLNDWLKAHANLDPKVYATKILFSIFTPETGSPEAARIMGPIQLP